MGEQIHYTITSNNPAPIIGKRLTGLQSIAGRNFRDGAAPEGQRDPTNPGSVIIDVTGRTGAAIDAFRESLKLAIADMDVVVSTNDPRGTVVSLPSNEGEWTEDASSTEIAA